MVKKSRKRRSDIGSKRSRKYKSRSRVACSTKRKRPCINNLDCHWITGKGCKRGKSKVSQAHLLVKKSRISRRSRRGRPRKHPRRSREAPRRSRRGRPRKHRRSRRSRRGRPRKHPKLVRRSRRGRPRKGVACSRKRKKPCIDNLACHWIIGKGCKAGIKKSRNKWGGNKGDIPLSARRDYIHTQPAASPQQKSPNIISPIRFDIPKSIPMNAEDEFEQDLISSGYYERMERLTHALKEQRALRDKFKNKKMPTIDKIGRKELSRIIKSTFQDLHHVDEIGTDYDPKLGSVFEALEDYAYPNKFNNDEKEFIKARFKAIQKSEHTQLREQ